VSKRPRPSGSAHRYRPLIAAILLSFVVVGAWPAGGHSLFPGTPARTGPVVPLVSGHPTAGAEVSAAPGLGDPIAPSSSGPDASWTNLSNATGPTALTPRFAAMEAYDPVDGYLVLFGGTRTVGFVGYTYGDTWVYAAGAWTELFPAVAPTARFGGMMTWDAADGYVLLFGGCPANCANYTLNDTWKFLDGSWTPIATTQSPPSRYMGAMAYDGSDRSVLLFGGARSDNTYFGDTWSYQAGGWTNLTGSLSASPTPRWQQAMAWDPRDGCVLLYGGEVESGQASDTWTFANGTWTRQSPSTGPGLREGAGLSYDARLNESVLFGGFYQPHVGLDQAPTDTWAYARGAWTDLSLQSNLHPVGRTNGVFAYDAADGYDVLFGGVMVQASGEPYLNDTWALGPTVIVAFSATPELLDLGQNVTFNATPIAYHGYTNTTYSNLPPGCTGGNVSSVRCTPSEAGVYNVTVSVNDSLGLPTNRTLTVTVRPDPSVDGFAAQPSTLTSGTRFWLNVSASGGTLPYSYTYTGLPAGCSDANTASLACTPTGTGSFSVRVDVRDAVGYHLTSTASVAVNPKPNVVTFATLPSSVDLGQSVALRANVTGGTAPLAYTYSGLPTGCAGADAPFFDCTPGTVGEFTVRLNASDAFGWVASGIVTFEVNPDPSIDSFAVAASSIDLGHPATFYLNASGGTGAFLVNYSGLPPGCQLVPSGGGVCTPTGLGTYLVSASLVDATGFRRNATVTITVVAVPSVTSLTAAPSAVDAGQNLTLRVDFVGGTAPFTFAYSGLPVGACSGTGTAAVSCRPRSSNTYSIVASVTDAWKVSSHLARTFTVYPDPSVSSFGASAPTVVVGASFDLVASVVGGSAPFSYVYLGLPPGCASTDTPSLVCTPTKVGTYNVSLNATDALGVSTTSFAQITVQAPAPSRGFLGLPGPVGYLLVAGVAAVAVAAIWVVQRNRLRPSLALDEPTTDEFEPDEPNETEP